MSFLRIMVLAAVVTAPLAASAADLPARYTVEEKPLKAAIAGTNLTFQLYSDPLCTASVFSTAIAIENVDLLGRIKPFNPKNAPKKKNTVELRATLTAVPATPSLYLKVTGTGVTPIGGACQSQASGLAGGGGSSPLLVKDSNGATVGIYDGTTNGAIYDDGGTKVRFNFLSQLGFSQSFTGFVFVSNDCTGTPLTGVDSTSLVRDTIVIGTTAYYFATSGAPTNVSSTLYRSGTPYVDQTACDANFGLGNTTFVAPDGCCQTYATFSYNAGAVPSIDLSGFVPPFSVQ